MVALKAQDKGSMDVPAPTGDVLSEFRGYDLNALGLPRSARPRSSGTYTGKHGYTLKTSTGAAARHETSVDIINLLHVYTSVCAQNETTQFSTTCMQYNAP